MTLPTIKLNSCPVCDSRDFTKIYQLNYLRLINKQDYLVQITKCQNCGFIFQNPRLINDILEVYYKNLDVYWEQSKIDIPNPVLNRFESVYQFILANTSLLQNSRILDIGTYLGQFMYFMKGKGITVDGIEINSKIAKLGNDNFKINIVNDSIYNIHKHFNPYSYDLITLNHVLEHVTDLQKLINSLHSLLKPNGLIFIEVPDIEFVPDNMIGYFSIEHLNYFDISCLERLMLKNRFRLHAISRRMTSEDDIEVAVLMTLFRKQKLNGFEIKLKNLQVQYEIIKSKLNFISTKYKKICIWGAGEHTKMLFGIHFLKNVQAFIDSSPLKQGKSLFNCPIITPEKIRDLNPEAILISSYASEKELFRAAKNLFPNLDTITIYKNY